MAIGYMLRQDDYTSCGGKIIDGDPIIKWHGKPAAFEGGHVTCGKHNGVYQIVGGISNMGFSGKRLAGTLDSYSSCPCHAKLLPSIIDQYIKKDKPLLTPAPYGLQLTFVCNKQQQPQANFAYGLKHNHLLIDRTSSSNGKSEYISSYYSEEIELEYVIQTEVAL